ncbi:hypothetical protein FVEG_14695 [Fusarium verticillioides 7600]|uniref:Uncharacterized protein n=1 Tax=Gibberella moniliformis (strain M3125 / FGSC 7600) TaxID=334819 RepID=W7LAQ0_GIBM7|nr:hypothetical protein FVEG_14695 [Fusarium verticillioides 7600]EWG36683.1 hypothetical protein FVEG_14695 [Fusarium verticillioides 7600]
MPLLKCSRNSCEQSLYIKQLKRILLYSTGPACMRFSSSIGDCFLPGLTAKRCRYRNLGNLLICGVFCLSMLQLAQLKLGRANNSIACSVGLRAFAAAKSVSHSSLTLLQMICISRCGPPPGMSDLSVHMSLNSFTSRCTTSHTEQGGTRAFVSYNGRETYPELA